MNYHYVTRETFEADVEKGLFIETATYAHNLYGTSYAAVDAVRNQGKVKSSFTASVRFINLKFLYKQICILDIEMNGVRSVKKSYLNEHTMYVMIVPPSFEELERRLRGRGSLVIIYLDMISLYFLG